jgi:hypothetical protein
VADKEKPGSSASSLAMGAASANDPAENSEFAPLISVKFQPFRLCQRFKLVNRTLEPHLTLLAQLSAQWVPTAYGRGALWSNARPRVLRDTRSPGGRIGPISCDVMSGAEGATDVRRTAPEGSP